GPRRGGEDRGRAGRVVAAPRRPHLAAPGSAGRGLPLQRGIPSPRRSVPPPGGPEPGAEVAQSRQCGRGGADRRAGRVHGESRDEESVRALPGPPHRLPHGAAPLHRREGQCGAGPPAGGDGALPLRGAGEGRPSRGRGLRPALAGGGPESAPPPQAAPRGLPPGGGPFPRPGRGPPRIRPITFKPIPEPFTRAAALRNGEVDLITTMPPNLGRELEKVPGLRVYRVPST